MEDGKKGRDNRIIFLYTFFNHFIFFDEKVLRERNNDLYLLNSTVIHRLAIRVSIKPICIHGYVET